MNVVSLENLYNGKNIISYSYTPCNFATHFSDTKTPQEEEVEDVVVEEEGVVDVDADAAVTKVGILILGITMVQYYNLKIL